MRICARLELTDRHTLTQTKYCNPRCACVLIVFVYSLRNTKFCVVSVGFIIVNGVKLFIVLFRNSSVYQMVYMLVSSVSITLLSFVALHLPVSEIAIMSYLRLFYVQCIRG